MSKFAITGGRRLKGELCPQGAKNEALQVICACLLTKEEVTLSNVPEILDVLKLIELLQGMGVQVGHPAHGEFVFKASDINFDYFETEDFYNKAVSLRGSIMILGPLLAVYGCGLIPKPGGDKIGRRRLDTHFLGFEKLGATFDYNSSEGCFRASAEKLRGCYMLLDEASVTGTANIIMAAVLAEGMTTIYNAACEPYIQQLCLMLNAMGARISGIASNLLTIEGVKELKGCHHRCLPDMIEVGSFIGMILFDRYGRIPIMKIGTIGSIVGLLIASYGLYTHDTGYITIFGILFFMLLFAVSWSVGAWVLISEVFPEKIKGFGMGLAVSLMWIANFLISLLFPVINDNAWLQETFGGAFSMWIFVVFNLVCYIFISRYVPETKGVPLTEIERLAENKLREIQGKRRDVIA